MQSLLVLCCVCWTLSYMNVSLIMGIYVGRHTISCYCSAMYVCSFRSVHQLWCKNEPLWYHICTYVHNTLVCCNLRTVYAHFKVWIAIVLYTVCTPGEQVCVDTAHCANVLWHAVSQASLYLHVAIIVHCKGFFCVCVCGCVCVHGSVWCSCASLQAFVQ